MTIEVVLHKSTCMLDHLLFNELNEFFYSSNATQYITHFSSHVTVYLLSKYATEFSTTPHHANLFKNNYGITLE